MMEHPINKRPDCTALRPPARRHRCGGWTLIELLVLVAIIVLLLSLMLPALGGARDAARASQCGANLHALAAAAAQHLTEHHQTYWEYSSPSDDEPGVYWWFGFEPSSGKTTHRPLDLSRGLFSRYLGDGMERMQCPAFPYRDGAFFPKFERRAASYGFNWRLSGLRALGPFETPDPDRPPQGARRYAARQDRVFLFADSAFFEPGASFNEGFYIAWQQHVSTLSGYAHFRHGDLASTLFLDGHVDRLPNRGDNHRTIAGAESGNLSDAAAGNDIYGDR